jgi:hypothetical protein
VTFPAYDGATVGVRSLTDWYLDGWGSDGRAESRVRWPPTPLLNFLPDEF